MVWTWLLISAVSFVALALLAPKPDIENARANELDPDTFPIASENSPVPLLLGCAKLESPNTLWYGDYNPVPITESIKVSIFKKETIIKGYTYYLSIDLGLCLGPDVELKTIIISDEEVSDGSALFEGSEEEFIQFGGSASEPDGTLTEPLTYTNVIFDDGNDWTFQGEGDSRMIVDLYDIFPTQELIEEAFADDEIVLRFNWDGYHANDQIIGGGAGSMNKSWQIGVFPDNGFGEPDYSNALWEEGATQLDTGEFAVEWRSSQAGEGFLNMSGARWVAVRSAIYPFNQTNYASDSEEGSPVQRLTVEHQYRNFVSSDIYAPDLFGGREEGGGHVGNYTFYTGNFNQPADPDVEEAVGVGNVPGYNGVAHIVMPNNNIGESGQLSKIEFVLSRYVNELDLPWGGRAFDGSDDISPIAALYHILTDDWSGISVDPALIDTQTFLDAAVVLEAEQNGCSLIVSSAQDGAKVVGEILRQIDGVLGQDLEGRMYLKLIRDDYDASLLPIYDEDDIIEINSYSRSSWTDVKNQVKVTYQSIDSDSTKVAIAQNMATINMVGKLATSEVTFPFVYDADLATALAARDLSQISVPLTKMNITVNRRGFDLQVGDVFKIDWPEYGLQEMIVRVQEVDRGDLDNNRVVIEVVQDVFAVGTPVIGAPEDSAWVSDKPIPVDIAEQFLIEMPRYFGSRTDTPIEDGFGGVIPFPVQPQEKSVGFDMNFGTEDGVLEFFDPYQVAYPGTGTLTAAYNKEEGFGTGLDLTTGLSLTNVTGSTFEDAETADIRIAEAGIIYVGGEWMAYENATVDGNGDVTLGTVYRGLFGTRPLTHLSGARVFLMNNTLTGLGYTSGELLEDGTLYYKLLDRVAGRVRSSGDVAQGAVTLNDIADRPERPRNLAIDGTRALPFVLDGSSTISWVSSNREADEVAFESDAGETPDQAEEYDLEVWIDGVLNATLSQTNVTSPHVVNLGSEGGTEGELRLYSRRTSGDMKSSVHYAWFPFLVTDVGTNMSSTALTMDLTDVTMDET